MWFGRLFLSLLSLRRQRRQLAYAWAHFVFFCSCLSLSSFELWIKEKQQRHMGHGCEYYCLAKCFEPFFSPPKVKQIKIISIFVEQLTIYCHFGRNEMKYLIMLSLIWNEKKKANSESKWTVPPTSTQSFHQIFYLRSDRLQNAEKKTEQGSERAETLFDAKTSRAAVIMIKCIRLDKLHSQQNDDDKNRRLFHHQVVIGVKRRGAHSVCDDKTTWVVFVVHEPRQL